MNELAKVTRFEVIDHRNDGVGRAYTARGNNLKVETSMQDSNRTMKVFLTDTNSPIPINRSQVNQMYAFNLLRESSDGTDENLNNIIDQLGEYIKGDVQ